jgi:Uma2 family endonuclease
MTMVAYERVITTEQFEQFLAQGENADHLFELVNGAIVEKMPTREHGIIAGRFVQQFNNYLDEHPIGNAAVEARHRPPQDTSNDRLPDVSVVLGDMPIPQEGVADYLPDLVVEVQSPRDSWRDMIEKGFFYLDHGSQVVLLVFPAARKIEKLTKDDHSVLHEDDMLDLSELLPGFSTAVKEFFKGV